MLNKVVENMSISNSSAGMADAYWYEWYVGLYNVLDMLRPESNIEHVVLQHEQLQGLDDIVVKYRDEDIKCIQVKNTRCGEKITFSNLIYKTSQKESLLCRTARDWKRAKGIYKKRCEAILYTNRKSGEEYVVKDKSNDTKYIRPELKSFLVCLSSEVKDIKSYQEFGKNHIEWEEAWEEWCTELECLESEEEKAEFLRCLDIKTNESDLKNIIEDVVGKLVDVFKISRDIAKQLDMKLCYALRTWTTTIRENQEITKEIVYQVLSIDADQEIGDHNIQAQEPIFDTRKILATELSSILVHREKPIVFLFGEPGCGKTNIVSDLVQRSDSAISLRFYTFKPLTIKETYMPPDGGIYDSRALWGNLLIGLRKLLVGNLSKYNVPPVNEFLNTVEELRSKVLEFAECLAKETKRTTVIVIDGIDHAVRAGQDNSFLRTLPVPESIPQNVCFLIVGQNLSNINYYPEWLTDRNRVLQFPVPKIGEREIRQLYSCSDIKLPKENEPDVIRIINSRCSGNTLAILFAMKEIEKCSCVSEIEVIFESKKLSSSINDYYEYIWKNAIDNIPAQYSYLENIFAGILSLLNKKVTPQMLVDICNEDNINVLLWKSVLDSLYPIIIEEGNYYMAYHNDIRVYLESRIKKNESCYVQVNNMISEYLLNKCNDVRLVHENIFTFLKRSNREDDYLKVFKYKYVYEAIKNKRPWYEIMEQLSNTLRILSSKVSFSNIVDILCSILTIIQYQDTLNWLGRSHKEEQQLPELLVSESKVCNKERWAVQDINIMFNDILLLLQYNAYERANSLYDRWLGDINPEQLYKIFEHKVGMTKELINVLQNQGYICRMLGIKFELQAMDNEEIDGVNREIRSIFSKGWLEAGGKFIDEHQIEETLSFFNRFRIVNTDSLEMYFLSLVHNGVCEKLYNNKICDKFSHRTKLEYLFWGIINGQDLKIKWVDEAKREGLYYILKAQGEFSQKYMNVFCKLVFVLAYLEYDLNSEELLAYFNEQQEYKCSEKEEFISITERYKYLASLWKKKSIVDINYFKLIIESTFDFNNGKCRLYEIDVEFTLLQVIIKYAECYKGEYEKAVLSKCIEVCKRHKLTHIDLYWEYLKKYNDKLLEELYDFWMEEDGQVWKEEIDEMDAIVEKLIKFAKEMGWEERIKKSEKLLSNKLIGYSGHKEYSLLFLHLWYKKMNISNNRKLNMLRYKLLDLSERVSEISDNRLDRDISTYIAEEAGRDGIESLWKFALTNSKWDNNWIRTIYDGIIAALENQEFTEQDLMNLWDVSSSLLPTYPKIDGMHLQGDSQNDLNHIYICDIRDAIILSAKRLDIQGIEEKMYSLIPANYELDTKKIMYNYYYPERWFGKREIGYDMRFNRVEDKEKQDITIDALFEEYETKIMEGPEKYEVCMDMSKLCEILKRADEPTIILEVPRILTYILERTDKCSWREEGIADVLYIIFKYISQKDKNILLSKTINVYLEHENYFNELQLRRLNDNFETYILCESTNSLEEEVINKFREVINMHLDWMNGFGTISLDNNKGKIIKGNSKISSWSDFMRKIEVNRERINYFY